MGKRLRRITEGVVVNFMCQLGLVYGALCGQTFQMLL